MKTNYNLSQTQTVKTNFEAYFSISFGPFYDGLISVMSKKITIDICKFDDWLHKKYGEYENEGLSMSAVILKHYGSEANEFIESLI